MDSFIIPLKTCVAMGYGFPLSRIGISKGLTSLAYVDIFSVDLSMRLGKFHNILS